MCIYCEQERRNDLESIDYLYKGGHYICFDKESKKFYLISDVATVEISHCPWCGRELKASEEEPEFVAEDEVARLDSRIDHTNKRINQLCDALDRYVSDMKRCRPGSTMHFNSTDNLLENLSNIRDN